MDKKAQEILSQKKISLIEIYLQLQKYAEQKYGPNTVVLMEVGSFFEVYGVDNDEMRLGKPKEIASVLNLQLTRKNKSIQENSLKNPLMAGFPHASFDRYMNRLVQQHKYTIVLVKQQGDPPNVERYIDTVLSPGVNIDYIQRADDAFVVSAMIDQTHDGIYSVGYAAVDITTGRGAVSSIHGTKEDPTFALDELFRLIEAQQTAEVILTPVSENVSIDTVREYLELHADDPVHVTDKRYSIDYQNELFARAYTVRSFLSPIEWLDLEKHPLTSAALAALLEFIIDHDHRVVESLSKPTVIEPSAYLYLGNHPLEQLNIISRDPHELTVLRLMDHTTTSIGKRLLKDRLLHPITSKDELIERYDLVDVLRPLADDVRQHLRSMYDLERIIRRIHIGRLHPFELNFLHESLIATNAIISLLDDTKATVLRELVDATADIAKCLEHLESAIAFDDSAKYNQQAIETSIFKKGYNPALDALMREQQDLEDKLEIIRQAFVDVLKQESGKADNSFVSLKQLDKDGHYISITKSRFGLIEDAIKDQFVSIDATVYALSDFRYKKQTSNVKITADIMDQLSDHIVVCQSKIKALTKELFLKELAAIGQTYGKLLSQVSSAIAQIDVAISCANAAQTLRLTRPDIIDTPDDNACLAIEGLRHPLVESREDHGIYVPNDIVLGSRDCIADNLQDNAIIANREDQVRGVLLYGINSSGKSSLMKSIGIAVILAQAGYFVPATAMRFSIIRELFTRIVAKDDLERGLSSFAVEMVELKNIFNRCGPHSLILGDEISHGTETLSALAIVSAAIRRLSHARSLFLFTTHLHQLHQLDLLNNIGALTSVHLAVHYDKNKDELIFDRTLQPGSGSSIYGLEFAQSLHIDDTFLKDAMAIRKQLSGDFTELERITKKDKSKYNRSVYLTSCAVCTNPVDDTHHITPQQQADEAGNVGHFHKNHKFNLLPLCKSCHEAVHEGSLTIQGFKMTSKGVQLRFDQNK